MVLYSYHFYFSLCLAFVVVFSLFYFLATLLNCFCFFCTGYMEGSSAAYTALVQNFQGCKLYSTDVTNLPFLLLYFQRSLDL